jgi:guanylate kinase
MGRSVSRDNFTNIKSEVERIWEKVKNVIFDIDVAGGFGELKANFKPKP